jgi:pentatricopeptide repeat protein
VGSAAACAGAAVSAREVEEAVEVVDQMMGTEDVLSESL